MKWFRPASRSHWYRQCLRRHGSLDAGDMWHEMTTLATGCRFDYFDELVKIATVNGRKAIGID